jgi:hypothetical protein
VPWWWSIKVETSRRTVNNKTNCAFVGMMINICHSYLPSKTLQSFLNTPIGRRCMPPILYITCLLSSHVLDGKEYVVKLFITRFSSLSCHFYPCMSKCSLQHPVFKHFWPIFFPPCDTPTHICQLFYVAYRFDAVLYLSFHYMISS